MKLLRRSDPGGRNELPPGFLAREKARSGRPGGGLPGAVAALLVAVTLAALFAVALVAGDYLTESGEIHRGVSVGGVSVGGMEREEAARALEQRVSGSLDAIELRGAGGVEISAAEIGLRLDAERSAERAFAVGREGNVFARLIDRATAALGTGGVEAAVDYRSGALTAELEEVTSELNRKPRSAAVSLEGAEPSVVEGRRGFRVDVAATRENVEQALGALSGEARLVANRPEPDLTTAEAEQAAEQARRALREPLTLRYGGERWEISPREVAGTLTVSDGGEVGIRRESLGAEISAALGEIEREAADARLVSGERGSVEVIPARSGRQVDLGALLDEIQAGIFEGRHGYEVPVSEVEPEFTTTEAEAARPNTMLGEFTTGYEVYDEPNRIENLKTASEAVDGTLLAPGETFSFNAAAAPLSRYEPSEVIVDGRLETALGGGLCQVASTLYMAANYAGLEIVERHPHYAELPYIRPGFDATVWFGSLDLKFRNNTGEYLLIEERVDETSGEVTARIYGQPNDRRVEMSSQKLSEAGETTRWRATRKVIEDGEVIESGPISTDTYQTLEPGAPAPTGLGG